MTDPASLTNTEKTKAWQESEGWYEGWLFDMPLLEIIFPEDLTESWWYISWPILTYDIYTDIVYAAQYACIKLPFWDVNVNKKELVII